MKYTIEKEIEDLKAEISRHNHLYYVENAPEISDEEYDKMLAKLEDLEGKEHVFGSSLSKKSKKYVHSRPMLSLSNSYNLEDLDNFHKRVNGKAYVAEAKLDGLSLSLIYRDGKMYRALTRGDGTKGEDISAHVSMISSIPKGIGANIEVRGEIIMTVKEFNRINALRAERGLDLFANPRNAAAGTVRVLDLNLLKDRKLDCYFYDISESLDQHLVLERLKELGFKVNPHFKYCKDMEEVKEFISDFGKIRKSLEYNTDGVVVKVDSVEDRSRLGATTKSPRWAVAFKYPAVQAVGRIKDVHFQIGRTGVITPVAEIYPVNLDGSNISSISLHNFDNTAKKDVKLGDYIFFEKGGDIIPKVVSVIKSRRDGTERDIVKPVNCPFCGSKLVEEGSYLVCISDDCEEKKIREISFFVSKGALNVEGLGPKVVERLFRNKLIKESIDIFSLNRDRLIELEGFSDLSVDKLLENIDKSKDTEYSKVLFALGIRHMGRHASKILSAFDIDEIMSKSEDEIVALKGIGSVTARSIVDFFVKDKNRHFIQKLKEFSFNLNSNRKNNQNGLDESKLFGRKVLITGKLSIPRESLSSKIELLGGEVVNSASKSVDILVVGESPGKKLSKIELLIDRGADIEIMSEDSFSDEFFK